MLPEDYVNTGQSARPLDEELMICKVCLKQYEMDKRHPKELDCQHVFCNGCINKYLMKNKNRKDKKVRCPICRELTRCGAGDSNALKTSEHSAGLVRLFQGLIAQRERKMMSRGWSLDSGKTSENDAVDEYGVEASRKVVVKSANPLLHPARKWSKVNWDSDDDESDSGNKNGGPTTGSNDTSEKNSYGRSPVKIDTESTRPNPHSRKSVKDMWNQEVDQLNNNNNSIAFDAIPEDNDTIVENKTDQELVYDFSGESEIVQKNFQPDVQGKTYPISATTNSQIETVQKNFQPDVQGKTYPISATINSQIEFPTNHNCVESPSSSGCQSPFQTYQRSISATMTPSQLSDDTEDLDWNYFTKTSTLGSPESTMKTSSRLSPDRKEGRSLKNIITNPEASHVMAAGSLESFETDARTTNFAAFIPGVQSSTLPSNSSRLNQPVSQHQPIDFGADKLVSPNRVKASWDGDKILVIDDSNSDGNIQIFSSAEKIIASFHIYGTLADACILDSSQKSTSGQIRVAAATSVGVEIYEAGTPVVIKTIPIGPASRIAEFKDGFVVLQQASLSICPNMKCNLVLHSVKLGGIISASTLASDHATPFIDVVTCKEKPDVIGLLTDNRFFLIDQTGNVLETIALDTSDVDFRSITTSLPPQISFVSNAKNIVIVNPNTQKIEVRDIFLFSGSEKSIDFPLSSLAHGERVLSGTMAGPDHVFLIQLGTKGTKLYSYKIA